MIMPILHTPSRRTILSAGAATLASPFIGKAHAAEAINFATWSAAVDQVKAHVAAFEAKTGIPVAYTNSPYAQYRESMVTKFTGGAPVDMLWVSDAWLPEFARAGWISPIDSFPSLMAYAPLTSDFCARSTTFEGKHYGLTYYTDYMSFVYNKDILTAAGIANPPTTWEEVTAQSEVIKARGLLEYPVLIGMAQESWMIEFISALVYSHGGRQVDDSGAAVMDDPKAGALPALRWLADAVQRHKIVSPGCVQTGELEVLKAATAGKAAFVLTPKYRLRLLNDPAQSQAAGKYQQILMPSGPGGAHGTVGWMRFYGMTPRAQANAARADGTAKLMEWFGGKADGEYRFQKTVLKDLALGFGIKSLFEDPEVRQILSAYGDADLMAKQQALVREKDTIAPWFGEWNDTNGTAWQQAVIGKVTPEAALKTSAAKWAELKKAG
jgi:multiple sugar transport system substrate-binding protein